MKQEKFWIAVVRPLLAAGALLGAQALFAEDRTIAEGESVTISENATYGTLVVNGELIVHANTLTVTRLVVATNITGTAKLSTELGAKIACSGNAIFGAAGGRAEVDVAEGSFMTIDGNLHHSTGYDTPPDASAPMASCFMRVAGTVTVNGVCYQGSSYQPANVESTTETSVFQLDEGGVFNVKQLNKFMAEDPGSQHTETWLFNGGVLASSKASSSDAFFFQNWSKKLGAVNLTVTNGNDIVININHLHTAIFNSNSAGDVWNMR